MHLKFVFSNCPKLVEQGHCKNPYSKRYMSKNCQESCSLCNLKLEKKEQSKIYITATAKIKNSSTVSEHLTTEKINENKKKVILNKNQTATTVLKNRYSNVLTSLQLKRKNKACKDSYK